MTAGSDINRYSGKIVVQPFQPRYEAARGLDCSGRLYRAQCKYRSTLQSLWARPQIEVSQVGARTGLSGY